MQSISVSTRGERTAAAPRMREKGENVRVIRRGRLVPTRRVVVTGLVATYPVGGVAWDYLQYVQGFSALGCDVTYLEDTGQWLYDPAAQTFTDDVRGNARHLNDALASLEPALARRWSLRAPDGTYHGLDEPAVARACAAADLFLNLSGACWLRDAYRAARVKAYVDTDPGYSQARISAVEAGRAAESGRVPAK